MVKSSWIALDTLVDLSPLQSLYQPGKKHLFGLLKVDELKLKRHAVVRCLHLVMLTVLHSRSGHRRRKALLMMVIPRNEARSKIENDPTVVVLEVLPEEQYREYHLPRAINVPFGNQFAQQIEQLVPDKSQPVILYCQNKACQASAKAARKLYELGYDRVYDYEAGKEDWKEAGLPVEQG